MVEHQGVLHGVGGEPVEGNLRPHIFFKTSDDGSVHPEDGFTSSFRVIQTDQQHLHCSQLPHLKTKSWPSMFLPCRDPRRMPPFPTTAQRIHWSAERRAKRRGLLSRASAGPTTGGRDERVGPRRVCVVCVMLDATPPPTPPISGVSSIGRDPDFTVDWKSLPAVRRRPLLQALPGASAETFSPLKNRHRELEPLSEEEILHHHGPQRTTSISLKRKTQESGPGHRPHTHTLTQTHISSNNKVH